MVFNELSLAGFLVGGLFIFIALRMILRRKLLFQFFWSLLALLLLVTGILVLFGGFDLLGYRKILEEEPVATLQFQRIAPKQYRVDIVDNEGNRVSHYLQGDQWQLDVRLIKWNDMLASLGFKPMYRLDRISGRYEDISEERARSKSAFSLGNSSDPGLDLWALARRFPQLRSMIDTRYGSATYLPMADAASFNVFINGIGLVARPGNEVAKLTVEDWE